MGVVLNQRATPAARWIHGLLHDGRLQPQAIAFSGHLARATGWHADPRRSGGGLLRLIGIHYVDLLRWWCGEPQGVCAALGGAPADDRVVAGMRYPSGLLASLQLSVHPLAEPEHFGPLFFGVGLGHARRFADARDLHLVTERDFAFVDQAFDGRGA